MNVETAAAMDRLPWLPDEPASIRPARRRRRGLLVWGAAVVVAVAGVGSWLGYRSVAPEPQTMVKRSPPVARIQLPEARPVAPEVRLPTQREVTAASVPEIRPSTPREVHIAPPISRPRRIADKPEPAVKATAPVAPPVVVARPVPQVGPWEPRVAAGAAGRLVQVGAFGSVRQAQRGWWYMVRAYPALSRLPAVVRPTRNSKGRIFYRFRVGTTSQAHSEILCQRMQRIRFSCAVVGLPWKAKVER